MPSPSFARDAHPSLVTKPTRAALGLMLLVAAVLAGCALPGGSGDGSLAPAPTATSDPWMGLPYTTPPGWQVYHAPEFALALPADWWVYVDVGFSHYLPVTGYSLFSPQQNHRATILVWNQLTAAQVRDDFCAKLSQQVPDTFAGLPMRNTTGDGNAAAFERIWTFVSSRGIVYQLWTDDGPVNEVAARKENRAVLETFAPKYSTWGCA